MSLKQKFQDDLKLAMREKNQLTVSVLRMVLAAVSNEEIRLGLKEQGLGDQEVVAVLKKQVKQRNDSIEQYQNAGDQERAGAEEREKRILEEYLPAQASPQEVERVVGEVLADHPGACAKDFGTLMKEAVSRLGGNADGKMVSDAIKARLKSS